MVLKVISTHVTAGRQAEEWCGKADFKISWIFNVLELQILMCLRDEKGAAQRWKPGPVFYRAAQVPGPQTRPPPRLPCLSVLTWTAGWWKPPPPPSFFPSFYLSVYLFKHGILSMSFMWISGYTDIKSQTGSHMVLYLPSLVIELFKGFLSKSSFSVLSFSHLLTNLLPILRSVTKSVVCKTFFRMYHSSVLKNLNWLLFSTGKWKLFEG